MSLFDILFNKSAHAAYIKEMYCNGAIILDVRTPEEFSAGHIEEAINIPIDQLEEQLDILKQQHKTFIIVCKSGARSSKAATMLKKAGIESFNGGGWETLAEQIL
jgi:phage shock protein E